MYIFIYFFIFLVIPLYFSLTFHTYGAALKLLRCGATVVVTTRFPRHALLNFAQEPDFKEWKDRLKLYPSVSILFFTILFPPFLFKIYPFLLFLFFCKFLYIFLLFLYNLLLYYFCSIETTISK